MPPFFMGVPGCGCLGPQGFIEEAFNEKAFIDEGFNNPAFNAKAFHDPAFIKAGLSAHSFNDGV